MNLCENFVIRQKIAKTVVSFGILCYLTFQLSSSINIIKNATLFGKLAVHLHDEIIIRPTQNVKPFRRYNVDIRHVIICVCMCVYTYDSRFNHRASRRVFRRYKVRTWHFDVA